MHKIIEEKLKGVADFKAATLTSILSIEEISYLRKKGDHDNIFWCLMAASIAAGIFPNTSHPCAICGAVISFIGKRRYTIQQACSYSCEQKRRRIADQNYQTNMIVKAVYSKTHNIDPITGMNTHEVSALKSAVTKSINGGYDRFRISIQEVHKNKKEILVKRLLSIITKYGYFRAFSIFVGRKCSKHMRFSTMVDLHHEICDFLQISVNVDLLTIFVVNVRKLSKYRACVECGGDFVYYTEADRVVSFTENTMCSDNCRHINFGKAMKGNDISARMATKWKDPVYREVQMGNLMRRYADPTYGKTWSIKMLSTMREQGTIEARRDTALKTKLKNGTITCITHNGLDDVSRKYMRYKADVRTMTENQSLELLENFENRSKRGYHVDHIFPISLGFYYGIPVEFIGCIRNLQMLPAKENHKKHNNIVSIPPHILEYVKEHNILLEQVDQ